MTNVPCPPVAVLERWLVGGADDDTAWTVERHVAGCGACAETLRTLRGEDGLVIALRPPLAPHETPFRDRAEALIPALKRLRPQDRTAAWADPSATAGTQAFVPAGGAELPGVGEAVGGYLLGAPIGAGGMGVVFRAEDPVLKRRVALKLIQPALVRSADARARFLREAQALAALEHDHVVGAYQAGEHDGVLYLAMPLLRGRTLQERVRDAGRPLPADEVIRVGREVAEGLAAAHAKGFVHRDVKPGNIWLEDGTDPPRAKVLDFGLVQALSGGAEEPGRLLGTPAYMAPEQAAGGPVDAQADLFALGCVLYFAATGRHAFSAPDLARLLLAVATEEPVPPRRLNRAVPRPLERLVTRLLRKEPGQRPASAAAVAAELRALAGRRASRGRRRRWLAGTAAALALAGAGGVAAAKRWLPDPPPPPGEVTFLLDGPDARLALRRGDEPEQVVDAAGGAAVSLPPGDYAVRALAATGGLLTLPDRVSVDAGRQTAVTVQLVGPVAGHKQHSPHAVGGVAPRGRFVLSAGLDRTVVAWDPAAAGRPKQLLDPAEPLRCVALSPDGKTLAVGVGGGGPKSVQAVRFYSPDTLERRKGEWKLDPAGVATGLAYSPDGRLLFTAQTDGTLARWDVRLGASESDATHCAAGVHAVAVSPDGKAVLTAGGDGTVAEWNAADLKRARTYRGAAGPVRGLAVLPGDRVAAAGDDRTVRVWDRAAGGIVARWETPHPVRALAASPDGSRLASGDETGVLRVWDVEQGSEIIRFEAHASYIQTICFTAEGRVATGGADGAVRLWAVPK